MGHWLGELPSEPGRRGAGAVCSSGRATDQTLQLLALASTSVHTPPQHLKPPCAEHAPARCPGQHVCRPTRSLLAAAERMNQLTGISQSLLLAQSAEREDWAPPTGSRGGRKRR